MTIYTDTTTRERKVRGTYGAFTWQRVETQRDDEAAVVSWHVRPTSSTSSRWNRPNRALEATLEEAYSLTR